MPHLSITTSGQQVLLHTEGELCTTPRQIVESTAFAQVVHRYVEYLQDRRDPVLTAFPPTWSDQGLIHRIVQVLRLLTEHGLPEGGKATGGLLAEVVAGGQTRHLRSFIENLYDWWRAHDRFMLVHVRQSPTLPAYQTFADTVEAFNRQVRTLYRELRDHVAGQPVRTYRQLAAGCGAGMVVTPLPITLPEMMQRVVGGIPCIRTLWMAPPLLMEPAATKRGGGFLRLDGDPMTDLVIDQENWFCFPAQVGPLVVLAYIHARFANLGVALANLFDLADDAALTRTPDAICLFGVPEAALPAAAREQPSFYDCGQSPLVGLIPDADRFAYFGYLKKTMLLLHNVAMMHRGRLPFHGAMLALDLGEDRRIGLLVIGDTGTGKSETIEALRRLRDSRLRSIEIIADDMGSLAINDQGRLIAYGTETGAFVRLDDLDRSYAFQTLDRAVFMNPQAENARVVLPVTSLAAVLAGTPVDLLLYANNHEEVDASHPVLERFLDQDRALAVFGEGAAMSKGTTTASGLVRNHFANIFGPPSYLREHAALAERIFTAAYTGGILVGQLRTRLGRPGCAQTGPAAAAQALIKVMLGDPDERPSRPIQAANGTMQDSLA